MSANSLPNQGRSEMSAKTPARLRVGCMLNEESSNYRLTCK